MPAAAFRQAVVPANAGTHNHRISWLDESRRTASPTTSDTAYGSRRSPGRRAGDAVAAAGTIASFSSTRDRLEAGDQFVDGLVDRNLLAHHPVHRLRPDVLAVQDRELPVLGEVERRGAAGELGPDRLPVPVSLPERARLACGGDREPAAERAFDVGPQIFFL